ncbi:MAG: Tetratricopeptide repeat protein [Acidobacteriales bacterium]|nr:Tetratricopeptide repeat protein [Terriglobales bacterium]
MTNTDLRSPLQHLKEATMNTIERRHSLTIFLGLLLFAAASSPAIAGTKEQLIQLQTQMQALQDQMARMQQSFDERMGVMRNLVEQTTDSVNKMNGAVSTLDKSVHQQSGESGGKVDQLSTQVQSLQDSVDELKGRLAKVSKQLEDMQAAQQNLNAAPAAGAPAAGQPQTQAPPQAQAPPADVLYNNGLRDYNAARFDLAQQEFGDYIKFYSTTDLAGNAQFYLADMQYRQGNYQQAVKDYDRVIEQYPGGNKAAAAQLKKGYALIELGQRDAGTKELRSLIGRYPRSIEATQAKDRLKKLGAAPTASKPSAARRIRTQ